jgi:ABC-type polysaccharide/polyol phosphate export permease
MIGQLVQELAHYRQLVWVLALKELRIRYKRSLLGFLWALLHPLLMMVVLTVVFSLIMRIPVEHYAVFLLSALLPWTFFSQALAYATDSLVNNADLIKKVATAKSVFPAAAVLANLINFVLSFVPLVVVLLVLGFPVRASWVYLPVSVLALGLFSAGCGFFLAAANVFFRDVTHIVQIILSAWFYASPVIYSLEFIPEKSRFLFALNPMVYLLEGFRQPIYSGRLPEPATALAAMTLGVLSLAVGYGVFRRYEESFVFYV